jgi:dihydrofolate synthase/folylpolyglutamate synthase
MPKKYSDTLSYLYERLPMFQRIGPAALKPNLDNTLAFCAHIGNPEAKLTCIHVAGTNGKGSVSHMLAAIFQEHGYKLGLYTSPHLLDFRERIKINGDWITQQAVVQFVESNKDFIEKIEPSFFEVTVAMAFDYFEKEKTDICIIETGLGGRLDSTNIITPILSVITNIGQDHMDLLGDTLQKVAFEKAGIIKPGVPALIGEYQAELVEVFENKAAQEKTELHFAINFEDCKAQSDLKGAYQVKNIQTAWAACQLLKKQFKLTSPIIRKALLNVQKSTGFRGRWQLLQKNPTVICDTGHNLDGIILSMQQLKTQKYKQLHIVWGMVSDKDTKKILPLLPQQAIYYFTQPSLIRAKDCVELQTEAKAFNLNGETYVQVEQAFEAAKKVAEVDDMIFIGGSTFVVADLLTYLQNSGS